MHKKTQKNWFAGTINDPMLNLLFSLQARQKIIKPNYSEAMVKFKLWNALIDYFRLSQLWRKKNVHVLLLRCVFSMLDCLRFFSIAKQNKLVIHLLVSCSHAWPSKLSEEWRRVFSRIVFVMDGKRSLEASVVGCVVTFELFVDLFVVNYVMSLTINIYTCTRLKKCQKSFLNSPLLWQKLWVLSEKLS